jgi:flavin-dependent dehydrogenase
MEREPAGPRNGETIEADLCIVGAGPAGLAIASTLAGCGRRVLLLES